MQLNKVHFDVKIHYSSRVWGQYLKKEIITFNQYIYDALFEINAVPLKFLFMKESWKKKSQF